MGPVRYRESLLGGTSQDILNFISSADEDREFIDEVVETFIAHVKALKMCGVIGEDLYNKVINVLNSNEFKLKLLEVLDKGAFEDVHEALEDVLKELLRGYYGYLVIGRSRNDHVATALRLKLLKDSSKLLSLIRDLRLEILNIAERNLGNPLPLNTHLQPAQLSTVSHYLLYIDDILMTHYRVLNFIIRNILSCSPLGSSAIAGSSVCIDRVYEAHVLGFNSVCINTLYATSTRDFIVLTLSVVASLLTELSRIFNDLIIWNSSYMSLVELPNEHLATSSVMPHKKNAVTLEVMRAVSSEISGYLTIAMSILRNTSSGYNLDLQEINKYVFKSIKLTMDTLRLFKDLISKVRFRRDKIDVVIKNNYYLIVTDIAELVSIKGRIPYREVHALIGSIVKECGDNKQCFIKKLCSSIELKVKDVCNTIKDLVNNPIKAIDMRCTIGSPRTDLIITEILKRKKELQIEA